MKLAMASVYDSFVKFIEIFATGYYYNSSWLKEIGWGLIIIVSIADRNEKLQSLWLLAIPRWQYSRV